MPLIIISVVDCDLSVPEEVQVKHLVKCDLTGFICADSSSPSHKAPSWNMGKPQV